MFTPFTRSMTAQDLLIKAIPSCDGAKLSGSRLRSFRKAYGSRGFGGQARRPCCRCGPGRKLSVGTTDNINEGAAGVVACHILSRRFARARASRRCLRLFGLLRLNAHGQWIYRSDIVLRGSLTGSLTSPSFRRRSALFCVYARRSIQRPQS